MPRLVAGATEEDRSETRNEPIPTVFARLHGELIPLTEGMVLDATDGCEILAKGSKYWNYNKVTTERTSDGWLVTEITWKHLKASPAPPKLPEGGEAKKAPVPKVKPANDKEASALHGDRLATLSAVERLVWA
jgi:hypothetical protein